jgi:hypothetical protein
MVSEKIYYDASEIAELLGVSVGKAYSILRDMNGELKKKGYLVIPGKIPTAFFREKWYGGVESSSEKTEVDTL